MEGTDGPFWGSLQNNFGNGQTGAKLGYSGPTQQVFANFNWLNSSNNNAQVFAHNGSVTFNGSENNGKYDFGSSFGPFALDWNGKGPQAGLSFPFDNGDSLTITAGKDGWKLNGLFKFGSVPGNSGGFEGIMVSVGSDQSLLVSYYGSIGGLLQLGAGWLGIPSATKGQ
jgi:hypothetical protein